jgi:flagellar hook-associated protein FlgK
LATVSNNIANVNSDGYSRQTLSINQNQPVQAGTTFLGSGARVSAVERQFDGFVENQLRVSTSDLAAQKPLVEYAGRILDRFASKDSALSGALDNFFSALGTLGADASSLALREIALSDAALLSDRFNALDTFLTNQGDASETDLSNTVSEINALATELRGVNLKLGRKDAISKQAPGLLDERDRLLRELAEKVRLDVTEAPNGVVTVRLGASAGAGALVEGAEVRTLGVQVDPLAEDRIAFFLEPAQPSQGRMALAGLGGGTLGGLVTFREQVLEPTRSAFDSLARGMVDELNGIHRAGMGLDGAVGRDLFALKPDYRLVGLDAERGFSIDTALAGGDAAVVANFELRYNPLSSRWSAHIPGAPGVSERTIVADESGVITIDGTRLTITGKPSGVETLRVQGKRGGAGEVVLSLTRAEQFAGADPLRLRSAELNGATAQGTVSFAPPLSSGAGPGDLATVLVNNPEPSSGRSFSNQDGTIFAVPAGSQGTELVVSGAAAQETDLRIFTREGILLSGPALSVADRERLLTTENGFSGRASYRAVAADETFRDLTLNRGVFADLGTGGNALLKGDRALSVDIGGGISPAVRNALESGALGLDGVALTGVLPVDGNGVVSAASVAAWLSGQAALRSAGVSASAETALSFNDINFSDHSGLTLNGVTILEPSGSTAVGTLPELVDAINLVTASSRVAAWIGLKGELNLRSVSGREGESILVDGKAPLTSDDNILGTPSGAYGGQLTLTGPTAFALTLGAGGTPATLGALGFDTRVRIEGVQRDDLLVSLSGAETVSVAARYEAPSFDALASLREEALAVRFEGGGASYVIEEVSSGTELARGNYLPGASIRYGGAVLAFQGQPSDGDVFYLEDNALGVDDNRNVQRLAALASNGIEALGSKSAGDYYASLASRLGTLSRQAVIGEQALEVVKAQAEEARDRISGVSLDEEAADLIRYQQAYQAAAKIIQTSQDLFDAVLAI